MYSHNKVVKMLLAEDQKVVEALDLVPHLDTSNRKGVRYNSTL